MNKINHLKVKYKQNKHERMSHQRMIKINPSNVTYALLLFLETLMCLKTHIKHVYVLLYVLPANRWGWLAAMEVLLLSAP